MITLRTLEIETEKDVDSLLTNLQWHTERIKIIPLNLFYFLFKSNVSRQWLGQIDRGKRQFKLLRNKGEFEFGARQSSIVCKGQIIEDSSKNAIKIDLQPTGYIFFNNLLLSLLTLVGIGVVPIDMLTEYWWALLLWTLLLTLNSSY